MRRYRFGILIVTFSESISSASGASGADSGPSSGKLALLCTPYVGHMTDNGRPTYSWGGLKGCCRAECEDRVSHRGSMRSADEPVRKCRSADSRPRARPDPSRTGKISNTAIRLHVNHRLTTKGG